MTSPRLFSKQILPHVSENNLLDVKASCDIQSEAFHELPANINDFITEKRTIACESFEFLLQQRKRLYLAGYPDYETRYLAIVESQLSCLTDVLVELHAYHPGALYCLAESHPDILAWTVLRQGFGCDLYSPSFLGLIALANIEDIELAKMIALNCKASDFDVILASLIENEATNSDLYFDYLVSRQAVSLELITHWLDSAKLPSHKLLPILALSNKKRGKVWLDQNYEKYDLIFEKLVVTDEAKNFLSNRIRDEEEHEETSLSTYFAFWPRAELMVPDMSKPRSYLPLILLGDTNCIPDAIEQMESSTEKDKWLQALYVMYGAALPIQPKDYIDEPVWDEVFGILYQWIDSGLYLCDKPIRLNRQLNFESSLMVLRDPYIDCELRTWIWRQLCVRSRMYFYWHPLLPKSQQDKVFSNLVASGVGQDRFGLAEV